MDNLGDRGRDQPDAILMVFDFLGTPICMVRFLCQRLLSRLTCAGKKSLLRPLHDLGKRKAEWEREIEALAVGK